MIEYLYNAIRVTANESFTVCANITDDEGNVIENCESYFRLYDDEAEILRVEGICTDYWEYAIPAKFTEGLKGKYWYCICADGGTLQFKQPIYFV